MSIAVKNSFDHNKVKNKSRKTKVNNKKSKNRIQKTSLTQLLNSKHLNLKKSKKKKQQIFICRMELYILFELSQLVML